MTSSFVMLSQIPWYGMVSGNWERTMFGHNLVLRVFLQNWRAYLQFWALEEITNAILKKNEVLSWIPSILQPSDYNKGWR